MKENKRYKCLICGKRNLNPKRYDEHMTCVHDVCLQEPNLEEYCRARDMWIHIKEKSSPKELETLTCDYDSELEMRYSEMESENESNTESNPDDSSDQDEAESSAESDLYSDQEEIHSPARSNLSSDSEDNTSDEETVKRRSSPTSMENQFDEVEEEMHTINDNLEDSYNSKTRNLNKLEEELSQMKSSISETKKETARLKTCVQILLSTKSDTDSTDTIEDLINKMESLIQKQTDERIFFSKKIEERSSQMKNSIKAEIVELVNIITNDPINSIEAEIVELANSINNDLAVAAIDNIDTEIKHDKITPRKGK